MKIWMQSTFVTEILVEIRFWYLPSVRVSRTHDVLKILIQLFHSASWRAEKSWKNAKKSVSHGHRTCCGCWDCPLTWKTMLVPWSMPMRLLVTAARDQSGQRVLWQGRLPYCDTGPCAPSLNHHYELALTQPHLAKHKALLSCIYPAFTMRISPRYQPSWRGSCGTLCYFLLCAELCVVQCLEMGTDEIRT